MVAAPSMAKPAHHTPLLNESSHAPATIGNAEARPWRWRLFVPEAISEASQKGYGEEPYL